MSVELYRWENPSASYSPRVVNGMSNLSCGVSQPCSDITLLRKVEQMILQYITVISTFRSNPFFPMLCRDVFCAGRVVDDDLRRTMKACGGAIQTSIAGLTTEVLGTCGLFQEEQIGGDR